VKGRKRHLLVDTLGLVLLAHVHAVDLPDRAGARLLVLDPAAPAFPAVAAAAAEVGAAVWPERPSALDLGRLDLRHADGRGRLRLAEWLTGDAVTGRTGLG